MTNKEKKSIPVKRHISIVDSWREENMRRLPTPSTAIAEPII